MDEPLDKKTIDRIERLSLQQIVALESKYFKVLTCDFDERYARLILSKVTDIGDQRKLLDAIRKGFDYCYIDFNSFNYERELPSYFEDWDNALAFGDVFLQDQPVERSLGLHCPGIAATLDAACHIVGKNLVQGGAEFHEPDGVYLVEVSPRIRRHIQQQQGIAAHAFVVDFQQVLHAFHLVIFRGSPEPARADGNIRFGRNPV